MTWHKPSRVEIERANMEVDARDFMSVKLDDAERALAEAYVVATDELGDEDLAVLISCARRLSGLALRQVDPLTFSVKA